MRSIIFALAALVVAAGAAKAEVKPGSVIGTLLCTMPEGSWKLYDQVPDPDWNKTTNSRLRAAERAAIGEIIKGGLSSMGARRLGQRTLTIPQCVRIGQKTNASGWPEVTYTRTEWPSGYKEEFYQRQAAIDARDKQQRRQEVTETAGIALAGFALVFGACAGTWYIRRELVRGARATVRAGLEAPSKTRSAVDRFAYKEED